ncbi:MAG TPA: hypothetical protein VG604_00285 [Candidatus Saccharimonadales bacterium]|nr:hypothetical protein [Candidatus Saccharimonadales bacterium]
MDYPNREAPSQAPAPRPVASAAARHHKSDDNHMGRVGVVAAIVVIALLLLGIIGVLAFGGPKAEDSYVDSNRLQAVFLNTGQVYFGNVKALNSKYVVLDNIYYLQTSSNGSSTASNSNTSVSLVKLGCELHEPLDQMVINRDQVTFWENLGTDGQVAKAVSQFEKQNPDGQKCASTSGNSTTSGSNTQPAPTTNGTTTNNATTKP